MSDNNPTTDNDQNPQDQSQDEPIEGSTGNTTHDLRKDAAAALDLANAEQREEAITTDVRDAANQALMAASHQDTDTMDDANEETIDKPLLSMPNDAKKPEVSEAAQRALQIMAEAQQVTKPLTNVTDPDEANFKLVLDIQDSLTPMEILIVDHLVIGRGDNISEFRPDIDFTPYGAYRLGLSRRHAAITVIGGELHVADLGSRNGTAVNGKMLDPNSPHAFSNGDEIMFGKLKVIVSFAAVNQ